MTNPEPISLPAELIVKIVQAIAAFKPALNQHRSQSKHDIAAHTLFQCALIDRQWRDLVMPMLWRAPVIDTTNIEAFINCTPLELGAMIKHLNLPSWNPKLEVIGIAQACFSNLQSLQLNHPAHGPEFIPTLDTSFINTFRHRIKNLHSLKVEDVDRDGWRLLLNALQSATKLKILHLETINEKDAFFGQIEIGMAQVFTEMKSLECLRLERVPIVSAFLSPAIDIDALAMCKNLKVVNLDYCDLHLDCLTTLWNQCEGLTFLGFAGLYGSSDIGAFNLVTRKNLKTLRFVDCELSDDIVDLANQMWEVCRNAPNLEMLRLVYQAIFEEGEHDEWNPNDNLTDVIFQGLARFCPKLTMLAFSYTSRMTGAALRALIVASKITILDFNTCEEYSLGILTDEFLETVLFTKNNIQVLNLYGQVRVSSGFLERYFESYADNIQSICLEGISLTPEFLALLEIPRPNLKSVSISEPCDALLQKLQSRLPAGLKLNSNCQEHEWRNGWFADEGLDINSLWNRNIQAE